MVCYSAFKALHQRNLPIFFMLIALRFTMGLMHGKRAASLACTIGKGKVACRFSLRSKRTRFDNGQNCFPKNLNKIGACIRDKFGLDVSKQTIKRVLKSFAVSWR